MEKWKIIDELEDADGYLSRAQKHNEFEEESSLVWNDIQEARELIKEALQQMAYLKYLTERLTEIVTETCHTLEEGEKS